MDMICVGETPRYPGPGRTGPHHRLSLAKIIRQPGSVSHKITLLQRRGLLLWHTSLLSLPDYDVRREIHELVRGNLEMCNMQKIR